MEFFEVLNTRRSIRSFTDEPVTEGEIDVLIEAGAMAPSARNGKPWHFIAVTDRATLDQIAERHPYAKHAKQAPLAMVVCGDTQSICPEFLQQDCAAATQNILLAARALGIGSCWCGLYPVTERARTLADILSIPGRYIPMTLIIMGRTEKEFSKVERLSPEMVHKNSW